MNAKMNQYYKNRIKKGGNRLSLIKYKTDNNITNDKLDKLENAINEGFSIYKASVLEKFLQAGSEIDCYISQFIKLCEYNQTCNSPYTNSLEKFIINYGKTLGTKKFNNKTASMCGENNPAYKHGGKNSPWSDKSIYHSKEVREKSKLKIKETKKNDRSKIGNTVIEYWLKKGYSEQEAKQKLKERQNTFSLDICIKKYGEEKGTEVWLDRQQRWQDTLNARPQDEIDRTNQLKGTGSGAGFVQQRIRHVHGFADKDCILYFIKLHKYNVWKIGVTSQTVKQRFGKFKAYDIIITRTGRYEDMFKEEQRILKKFKKYRIKYETSDFSSYECFNTNILLKQ